MKYKINPNYYIKNPYECNDPADTVESNIHSIFNYLKLLDKQIEIDENNMPENIKELIFDGFLVKADEVSKEEKPTIRKQKVYKPLQYLIERHNPSKHFVAENYEQKSRWVELSEEEYAEYDKLKQEGKF